MQIGQINHLTILRFADPGAYLGDSEGEVLLPGKFVPRNAQIGHEVDVFLYLDSEDRPVATTQTPVAKVGDFAFMKVISNSKIGAFVDWGLDKDLLLPFAAQASPVEEGRSYVMRVVLDDISGRIIASTRLNRYVDPDTSSLIVGQPVSMLIHRLAPHGALAIVDNRFVGLIPSADLAERVHVGETKRGFVQKIRPDGKIALALSPVGYRAVMNEAPRILEMLHSRGGFLPYSDASNPDEIRKVFGMSKGAFKKVIGGLMRDGQIEITHHGIRLLRS